jgi:hypothetical protein
VRRLARGRGFLFRRWFRADAGTLMRWCVAVVTSIGRCGTNKAPRGIELPLQ